MAVRRLAGRGGRREDELKETDGVTKLTVTMVFRDKAGRDHMTKHDGQESSFDKLEDYLMSLLDKEETP